MNEPTLTHELTEGEAANAASQSFDHAMRSLRSRNDFRLAVEVLPSLVTLAYQALQIHALGSIDGVPLDQAPAHTRRMLEGQARVFLSRLHPTHEALARAIAEQATTPTAAIARYLALLATPYAELMTTEPPAELPRVLVLWRCDSCGRLYETNVHMCSSGHLAQHVVPVEAVAGKVA